MKTITLKPYNGKKGRLKHRQHGMTLIEVLIAMFVLSIGILALLSVQLRSVSGVREAESQTIVSQITQNLIEGMLVNPTLSPETDGTNETGRVLKSYEDYLTKAQQVSAPDSYGYDTAMSKAELATAQLAQFRYNLASALPEAEIYFAICCDNSGDAPVYENNTFNAKCSKPNDTVCRKPDDTVIKVLWLSDAEEKQSASGLKSSGNYIIYTHQSRVTE